MFLEIKGIRKSYGTEENRVEVLKGIDLEIEKGQICVLLGQSGSGKSTLLNIIGGIDNADSGYVSINGEKTEDMDEKKLTLYRRKHLGYVFQMYNLIPNLNVKENIEVGAYLSDNPLDIDDLLKTLGLYEHRHKLPNQLSGGQQQRVSIGRAIVKNPDILLCDEPTGALDYNTSKEILKLIEEINHKYNNTVLMVTHNDAIKNMAAVIGTLRASGYKRSEIVIHYMAGPLIVTLVEKYTGTKHSFKVKGYYNYPAALSVFVPEKEFCAEFNIPDGAFNGYFSNKEITDIDEKYIATKITEEDLTKMSRQLERSMGSMFYMFYGFAIILFMIMIYILAKVVIEKNSNSISMVKILGYNNNEIRKLYMTSTTIMVAICLALSLPVSYLIIRKLYYFFMGDMKGWLTFYIKPDIYWQMFLIGMASYFVVELILSRKIRKIPMSDALKNVE